ncbi:DNA binding domain protein, excisionase family [Paenibacillus curdlanolyticus YK9]|uniref:DNA binding domain protein, excisionase family n=2 Tax=Paenibacillus curdlanolyticus TaxID=59840 RepID=E0IAN9_9BACL|nr:helix-turn-helix domain-containing protein [Paenibacillus curdlanolyticus]EFM10443.1 DNA binding domain protein, excisionase family [Paenibacillus curdlanolyticus YK9]
MPNGKLPYVTLQQAMDMLGVSRSTIDRWRRNKRLPYVQIGKEIMIDPVHLDEWIRAHAIVRTPGTPAFCERNAPITVTIGYQSATAHMWSPLLIRGLKLFEQELAALRLPLAVQVEWRDAASGLSLVEAMIGGHVQIASLGDYPIMMSQRLSRMLPDFDAVLLAFDGKTAGGRGISVAVASDKTETREELPFERIATVPHSSAGCRLNRLMRASGRSNLRVEHCTMKESWDGLVDRKIEASVMWEPYISLAQYVGAGSVLFEEGIGEDYLTGVVASTQWARSNEDIVIAYLKAHLRAHQYMRDNPIGAARVIAAATGFPLPVVAGVISRVRWDAALYARDFDTLDRLMDDPFPASIAHGSPAAAVSSVPDYLDAAALSLSLPPLRSEQRNNDWSPHLIY